MRKVTVEASPLDGEVGALVRSGPTGIDVLSIPPGTLCVVNALAGEVWMAQGYPQRRWLADMELDAWAATVV